MKIVLPVLILFSFCVNSISQSTTEIEHKDTQDKRETIFYTWQEGKTYRFHQSSTTLHILAVDTLENSKELDTISK